VNIHIPSWGGGLKPAEESLIGTKSYKKFVNSNIEPTIKNTLYVDKLSNKIIRK